MSDIYRPRFGEPVADWHRWFAWRPVETVDRGWRWMRPLWRRRIAKHDYLFGGTDFWFQHAHQSAALHAELARWLGSREARLRVADAIVDAALASPSGDRLMAYASAALAALTAPTAEGSGR